MVRIALIAHDKKKNQMVELTKEYRSLLSHYDIVATGTTGGLIVDATGLNVHRYQSGPLGGDQQIGAAISEGLIDIVIFLRDPLTPQAHEPDISALMRLCDVYEIPLATNQATGRILLDGLAGRENE